MDLFGSRAISGIQRRVLTPRVKLLALCTRVEDAEVRGRVTPAAGDPLPAAGVIAEIGVDQRVPEPRLAGLPGNQQVLDQKEAVISLTRLCIQPECQSWRIPASTIG